MLQCGHATQVQHVVDRVCNRGNKFNVNKRRVDCIGHLFTMSIRSHCLGCSRQQYNRSPLQRAACKAGSCTGRPGVISRLSECGAATRRSKTNYKTCAVISTADAHHGPVILLQTMICWISPSENLRAGVGTTRVT
jgi:hypothetical protein